MPTMAMAGVMAASFQRRRAPIRLPCAYARVARVPAGLAGPASTESLRAGRRQLSERRTACSPWMHRAKRCRIPGERAGQRWEPAQRRLHSRSLQVLSVADLNEPGADVCFELWISLASLLRSYTALHGLNGNRQATTQVSDERIVVSRGSKQLHLERMGASIIWKREDGSRGTLKLTETGQLQIGRA